MGPLISKFDLSANVIKATNNGNLEEFIKALEGRTNSTEAVEIPVSDDKIGKGNDKNDDKNNGNKGIDDKQSDDKDDEIMGKQL